MMEPMALGSPVNTPASPSPYLPGFLMGDPTPQPLSPSKTPRQVHFASHSMLASSSAGSSPKPGLSTLNDSLTRFHKNQREKAGGPPTVGLFDTLEVSTTPVTNIELPVTPQQPTPTTQPGFSTPTQHSVNLDDGDRWVTVFGFPPAAASLIISQFSQVGHILEHRFPGQGNWVNICYSTRIDARRALAHNGKIIGGQTMVGVVPCKDYMNPGSALKDMTNSGFDNRLTNSGTPTTPKTPQPTRPSHRRLVTSPLSSPFLSSPRAGRPSGIMNSDNEVTTLQSTPTQNTSFVSKAVDYVFGW